MVLSIVLSVPAGVLVDSLDRPTAVRTSDARFAHVTRAQGSGPQIPASR